MRLLPATDFVKQGIEPGMLIEGLVAEKSILLIAGEPFTGKTMMALELAIGVASGTTAFGRPARQGRVVYLGMDSPKWDLARQARKMLKGKGIEAEKVQDELWFHWGPPERVLNGVREAEKAIAQLRELGAEMLIVDTLRKAHLHEENTSMGMAVVTDMARAIADEGVALVLLHHLAKPKEGTSKLYQTRGSTVLPGSVDVQWSVSRTGPDWLTVDVPKARVGSSASFGIRMEQAGDGVRLIRAQALAGPQRAAGTRSKRAEG